MVLIYLPKISNRANYIFQLMFSDLLGIEYKLTSSLEEYSAFRGPRIFYANEPAEEGLFILCNDILFQNEITYKETSISQLNSIPILFSHGDSRSALPFDPFAAAFYVVTRYEEYLTVELDRFGRFKATKSVAHEHNFLHIPIVHYWGKFLLEELMKRFPEINPVYKTFSFVATIDIDHAYAYGHRSAKRTFGGYLRDLKRVDFKSMIHRTSVLLGSSNDPYNIYDMLNELHGAYDINCLYFILFADYRGHDNNVSLTDKDFRSLIKRLDSYGVVGIHPSLSSNRRMSILEDEIYGLSDLLERDILISRQHFLKF